MKCKAKILFITLLTCFTGLSQKDYQIQDSLLVSHIVNLKESNLNFYWKDNNGIRFKNFKNLKKSIEKDGDSLLFAVNGGMFHDTHIPVGLYIEKQQTLNPLDTLQYIRGNFYMVPNGVFSIDTNNNASVIKTSEFAYHENIKHATQSGPMLIIDGQIHPKFTNGSINKRVRNGVGVLPDGSILFAMSKAPINFYDFAFFFKERGCKNALYLDGGISKTYLPKQNLTNTDGEFVVIIAETLKN